MNPLFWLHQRISGSSRAVWIITGAYALVILLFYSVSQYVAASQGSQGAARATQGSEIAAVWLGIVSAGQALFLLILTPAAVRKAVLKDFQTGMIESHRVSPMSAPQIVTGYLTGPAVQQWLLTAVGCIFAIYFLVRTTTTLGIGGIVTIKLALIGWFGALMCVLVLSMLASSLVLLVALASSGKATIVGLAMGVSVFGGWVTIAYVPGLALLTGVMASNGIYQFAVKGNLTGDIGSVFVGAILQAALTVVLIWAACRVIRSPHRSIFSMPTALTLTILCGAVLAAGIGLSTATMWMRRDLRITSFHQVTASLFAFMLIGLFLVNSAAVDRALIDRAALFGQPSSPAVRRICDLAPIVCGLMGILLLRVMLLLLPDELWSTRLVPLLDAAGGTLPIGISLLCFSWTASQFYYRAATRRGRTVWLALAVCVILAAAPMVIDTWLDAYQAEELGKELPPGQHAWKGFGWISSICPLGTLNLVGVRSDQLWFGVAVQVAIAVGSTFLARFARRSLAKIETYESVRATAAA